MVKNQKQSIWQIFKCGLKDYIKVETSSGAGIVNLLFGVIFAGLLLAIQVSAIIEAFGKFFREGFTIGMPWYGNLIIFLAFIIYSWYCVKSLMEIEKTKQNM